MSDIVKKPDAAAGSLTTRKIMGSSLHQRVAAQPLPPKVAAPAVIRPTENPFDVSLTLDNRIGMMLDDSSSMGEYVDKKSKIEHLREACSNFLQSCDFSNTACVVEPFNARLEEDGEDDEESNDYEERQREADPLSHLLPSAPKVQGRKRGLCNIHAFLQADVDKLAACGGTPMAQCMQHTLNNHPLTRGVLVSDGEADNAQSARDVAVKFRDAEVPIDCVHIGRGSAGEQLLKQIAEMTGGMFIKFDNVENFAKNFKYLAPAFRAMLTSGQVSAAMLGAKEVK